MRIKLIFNKTVLYPFITVKRISVLLLLVFAHNIGLCQFFDSLQLRTSLLGTAASRNYQPIWIASNRYGIISDDQADLSTAIQLKSKNILFRFENKDIDDGPVEAYKEVVFSYGANLVNNTHFGHTFFEQAVAKLEYKHWSLRYGRFEEVSGDVDKELSSGSLGISGNAVPIPKLGIAVTEYTPVPFTNGFLTFKGSFAHGWFGNDRYYKDAFYHEKSLYVKLGRGKFQLYGGIQHFAEWGGRRGNVQRTRSWKGFWDVVLVKQADDGSVGTAINGIAPSRPGDQRGLLEAGLYWDMETVKLHGYAQMPFESGEEIDPRNRSFLSGLSIEPKESKLRKILVEFLYTKNMNDFVSPVQRNSYYNNGEYKTGWEYENRIIGTPLFMNRTVASHYFENINPFNWNGPNTSIPGNANIVDNRLAALHFGAIYTVNDQMESKTLFTYSRNYGSLKKGNFDPGLNQCYFLQELNFSYNEFWQIEIGLGFDFGQLKGNLGTILGVTYRIL